MSAVNNPEVDLPALMESTTISSPDKARRPQYKPSNESAAQRGETSKPASVSGFSDWDVVSADGTSRHRLTAANVQIHNMLHDRRSVDERIRLRTEQRRRRSALGRGTLTRCSEATIELGEPYSPACAASMPDSDIVAVGAWTLETPDDLMS